MAKCIGKITFSDASDSACGAFVQLQPGVELVSHQNWSIAETTRSSTWRELKAVCFALEAFASRLSGSKSYGILTTKMLLPFFLTAAGRPTFNCFPLEPSRFVFSFVYFWFLSGSLGTLTLGQILSVGLSTLMITSLTTSFSRA